MSQGRGSAGFGYPPVAGVYLYPGVPDPALPEWRWYAGPKT